MMTGIAKNLNDGTFSCWKYIVERVLRLWPMVLLAGAVSLVIGYFTMLPDHFENVGESVVASNFFANNILECITTKNYWDVANLFKPLMHMWYLGVLMQSYIALSVLYAVVFCLFGKKIAVIKKTVIVISTLSLCAYLAPIATSAMKFYYFPFRIFEITAGSCVALFPLPEGKVRENIKSGVKIVCMAVLLLLLIAGKLFAASGLDVILTVLATTLYLFNCSRTSNTFSALSVLPYIGKISFSIYVVHQIIIAFTFYAIAKERTVAVFAGGMLAIGVVSMLVYRFVECPLGKWVKQGKRMPLVLCIAFCLVTTVVSLRVYINAGVVRDVPELGIYTDNIHRGMHAEYCDIPYAWDKDFVSNDKIKVLVLGNSFARDFANILNESDISDELEISYFHPKNDSYAPISDRLKSADIIFRAFSDPTLDVDSYLPQNVETEKLYLVGFKNYGASNGFYYCRRSTDGYFDQTVHLNEETLVINDLLKERFGNHYIDMIGPVQNADGSVRIFTDDHFFISQDCRHLTQYGAKYYGRILDLDWILDCK